MTKLGAHVRLGSRNGYENFVRAKPRVVLAVNEGGALLEAKRESQGHTTTIFRDTTVYLEAPGDLFNLPTNVTMEQVGWYWYAEVGNGGLRRKFQENPADYYCITNEQGGNSPRDLAILVDYERVVTKFMNADGFKACVLNLPGGSPGDFGMWKDICAPFIIEAWASGNVYGRHAYGEGDLVDHFGQVIPGNPSRPLEEIHWLNAEGHNGGMAVTECGLDAGYGYAGNDRFVYQMTSYEKRLRAYTDIIGLCAWDLGSDAKFKANWESAIPYLVPYMIANPLPPWPEDKPPPPPVNETLEQFLWTASVQEQVERGIPLNANAALQQRITQDGLVPVHRERSLQFEGKTFVIQAAEDLRGIVARRVYVWQPDAPIWYFLDPGGDPPPPPVQDNLLANWSFEGGWYHPDGIPELQIPAEWSFDYKDETTPNPVDSNPWSKFVRPEVRVLPSEFLPPEEAAMFILDGDQTVKIFKGSGSIWPALIQIVDLASGQYELVVNVFADLVKGYTSTGKKIWADDPAGMDGRIRISVDGEPIIDWISLVPGETNTIKSAFTASRNGPATIRVEFMLPFALANNGLFVDAWELIKTGSLPPPEPDSLDMAKYFVPPDGREYGSIYILRNNWGQGDERVQLQRDGDFSHVTKNQNWEKRLIGPDYIDLVMDTSPAPGEFYTVDGHWLPRKMKVGEVFDKHEYVQWFFDNCSPNPNKPPANSTTQMRLIKHHDVFANPDGLLFEDVIVVDWIVNGRVDETYWFAAGFGLIQWLKNNAEQHMSWVREIVPDGSQHNNERKQINCPLVEFPAPTFLEAISPDVPGVDVSHWQGRMNWDKNAQNGSNYAFIKATEGTGFVDSRLDENVKGATQAGLFASLYHFYRPQYNAIHQASHFAVAFNFYINILPETALPIIDLEIHPTGSVSGFQTTLLAFIAELKRLTGRDPMIYTNVSFYNSYLQGLGLEQYPLWIAYYNTSVDRPLLPRNVSDWEFWQYTSKGSGSYYGASSTYIDLNTFNGTLEEFEDKYNQKPQPPEPCVGTPPEPYRATRYWVDTSATCVTQLKVFALAMERGVTFCWSVDEALQGNLEDKTAVFWNMSPEDQVKMREWATENYPEAKVEFQNIF